VPKRKTKEEFTAYSRLIHGNRYNYELVEYINNKVKVKIGCELHGVFEQTPNDHIGGHGCRKCSEINQLNYNLKEAYSDKNKDYLLDLYVVSIDRGYEKFIKVGISRNYIQRLKNIKVKASGEVNLLYKLPCTLQEATLLEDKILFDLRVEYKKHFNEKFSGYTECLNFEAKDEVISKIKEFLKENHRSGLVGKILDYIYKK
jgi:hypothetical protein